MKIMVLGGGHCQLNMIKRLRKEDHHVVLIDYLENCPGARYANEHIKISTFDITEVSKATIQCEAEGIMTMGTDQPVLAAAIAAEESGLPFYINPKTALSVTNKRIMKRKFVENNIPSADYRLIGKTFRDSELSGLVFPVVMKPVDSQGQRGVFRIEDIKGVRENIEETLSYSKENKVLIEEYYENDEITVNGWIHEGKSTVISVVDRVTMDVGNRIGICHCHNNPSLHLEKYKDEITILTRNIVDSFELENGPLYFQFMIGGDGLKVNEIAMRIGGAYEDITIPVISGIDILGMTIDFILGRKVNVKEVLDYDFSSDSKYISTQMFFIEPGKIAEYTPVSELMEDDYIKDAYYIIEKDSSMEPIKDATARAGYFIVKGSSFEDMEYKINKTFEKLKVLNEKGENLVMEYSEYRDKYKMFK